MKAAAQPAAPESKSFAIAELDRLMGFFPRVEGKASFVLALNIAMLGLLALNYPMRHIGSPRGAFGIVAAFYIFLSVSQLYVVFFPHLKPGDKPSLIYFQDVAAMGWRRYHQAVSVLTEAELLEDLTCQIWRNAEILKIKYDRTRSAFLFTLIALPFWIFMLLALALRDGKIVLGG